MTPEQVSEVLQKLRELNDIIVAAAREVMEALTRWYYRYVYPVMRELGVVPPRCRPMMAKKINRMLRGGAAAARRAHNPKVDSSNLSPATNARE